MFAMIPVNISTSLIIKSTPSPASRRRNLEIALSLLIFSAVVFRAELAALAGLYALEFLVSKRVSLMGLVRLGVVMTLASVALTVMVDSYFWQQFPLWPELKSIHFNIYEGKSSDWGVSPFYTYFATDIPKLFMASLPLLILGAAVDPFSQWMLLSSLGFVTVLSCIGHKEWRFIVYVVPLGNVIAAKGATWLFKQRQRGTLGLICILTVFSALCVNALVTALMTSASAWNYPGGTALSELHKLFPDVPKANIYIDNLAAQTGASMFLQENSPPFGDLEPGSKSWTYVKTENLKNFEGFSHVISEDRHSPGLQEWVVVKGIDAFGGGMGLGDITKGRMPSVKLETKLWIMEPS
ncbi:dolichyl-P-Man:Man(7)GlcNAc(2)-PP-dolichol alpha-1,6-mannosyltransferase [Tulasnella sp. 418]|nr:dolichyl-P-Man:Man(7)GlcNAc(2)-PP-dolichol alpha-1,6-mannosyltransferase [Tulasnella sp. 418]